MVIAASSSERMDCDFCKIARGEDNWLFYGAALVVVVIVALTI